MNGLVDNSPLQEPRTVYAVHFTADGEERIVLFSNREHAKAFPGRTNRSDVETYQVHSTLQSAIDSLSSPGSMVEWPEEY